MARRWLVSAAICALTMGQCVLAAPKPIRVLFVGNSLTYFNSLPELTAAVAASLDSPVRMQVEMLAAPGATIRQHLGSGHLKDVLTAGRFEVVVLQELGGFPLCSQDYPGCMDSPAALAEAVRLIKAAGARALLLGTYSPLEMQPQLSGASAALATRLHVELADWGGDIKAFAALHPELPLIGADHHPLPLASWLAATHLARDITKQPLPVRVPEKPCAPQWAHAKPPLSNASLASQQPQPPLNCYGIPDSTYQLIKSVVTRD